MLAFLPIAMVAQQKIGYFNYTEVLELLPEYARVKAEYDSLQLRCNNEILHNEEELTRSYVAFLEGQKEFPEPILRKRQKELQEMVDRSVLFRDRLKRWLIEARDSMYAPLYAAVDAAVERVCLQNNLVYAIDIENGNYVYVSPNYAYDITEAVLAAVESMKKMDTRQPIGAESESNDTLQGEEAVATEE